MREQRSITVRAAPRPPLARRPVETCEHKGAGHPDTLADGACEAAAVALAQVYLSTYGQVLHFNLDKGLLVAGRSTPRFGGGQILDPIKLIVCGRASNPGGELDIGAIVTAAVEQHLKRTVPNAIEHFRIAVEVKEGSGNLQRVYAGAGRSYGANDTSIGVGYAPLSELERQVLDVAEALRSAELRHAFPVAGADFKIMGVRSGTDHALTLALALIDQHLTSAREYFEVKQAIQRFLERRFPAIAEISINALDDPAASTENGVYLTVSGLSAEMGDDGQVGRGNRVNGLITPGRPMSLEAAAGKNPVSHVGKVYNVLASTIASAICAEVPEVSEANVLLVSRIGEPLTHPWVTAVEIVPVRRLTKSITARVAAVVEGKLDAVEELTQRLLAGQAPVY